MGLAPEHWAEDTKILRDLVLDKMDAIYVKNDVPKPLFQQNEEFDRFLFSFFFFPPPFFILFLIFKFILYCNSVVLKLLFHLASQTENTEDSDQIRSVGVEFKKVIISFYDI